MSAMHWSRWGSPDRLSPLPDQTRLVIESLFGACPAPGPELAMDDLVLAEPALSRATLEELAAVVGAEHVRVDRETRIRHTRGKSTPDLLRIRARDVSDAPDAVLTPAGHDDVVGVLAACERHHVAVVPFGGGTSVVGGLAASRDGFAGVVALDLARLDQVEDLDEVSHLATLGPGLRGPQAERLLGERGFTLGHFPQSFEYASIGGFAATRSSGQASAGYGRFDSLVMGLRVATPRGTVELGTAPASAAGPDLRQLFLGSEGALGVITAVTVRVRRAPQATVYETWRFGSFSAGVEAMRALAQSGELPTVLRLADEAETALNLAAPDSLGRASAGGCLLLTGYEGTAERVAALRARVCVLLESLGGTCEGEADGRDWVRGRYEAPYLRDALLDLGLLVETVETATFWSRLEPLYAAVRGALAGTLGAGGRPAIVLCHVSHVYETGASLYFTVAARQDVDALAQWQHAKAAASEAIRGVGATITHHHGVGRDHLAWYAEELGAVGVEVLRSVKATLDPSGILNPGVLIP